VGAGRGRFSKGERPPLVDVALQAVGEGFYEGRRLVLRVE
jgi:hypothetical protein